MHCGLSITAAVGHKVVRQHLASGAGTALRTSPHGLPQRAAATGAPAPTLHVWLLSPVGPSDHSATTERAPDSLILQVFSLASNAGNNCCIQNATKFEKLGPPYKHKSVLFPWQLLRGRDENTGILCTEN